MRNVLFVSLRGWKIFFFHKRPCFFFGAQIPTFFTYHNRVHLSQSKSCQLTKWCFSYFRLLGYRSSELSCWLSQRFPAYISFFLCRLRTPVLYIKRCGVCVCVCRVERWHELSLHGGGVGRVGGNGILRIAPGEINKQTIMVVGTSTVHTYRRWLVKGARGA